MRYQPLFAAALVSVSALSSTAFAQAQQRARDCVVAGALNSFGTNSTGTITVNAGESCNMLLNTAGTLEASEISAQPKNGTLRMEGMANAIYTPKAGFTGDDEFAFTIKGRNQQVSGTSVLVIRANVK